MNKITTLVPLSEFIDLISKQVEYGFLTMSEGYSLILKYQVFLKHPLELGFFVPCDANGNYMEDISNEGSFAAAVYNESKSKILFEGFEWNKQGYAASKEFNIDEEMCVSLHESIESISKHPIPLTEQALKQIYG